MFRFVLLILGVLLKLDRTSLWYKSYKLLEPESEVSINSNLSHVNNQIVRHFPIGNGKSDLLQQFYV